MKRFKKVLLASLEYCSVCRWRVAAGTSLHQAAAGKKQLVILKWR